MSDSQQRCHLKRRAAVGITAAVCVGAMSPPPAARSATPQPASACTVAAQMARMSLEQKVGQMFMVGTPAARLDPTVSLLIANRHFGNVFLAGRSYGGVAPIARMSAAWQWRATAKSTAGVKMFIATDQEGGAVQVLQGTGFSAIPKAVVQGQWAPATIQASATTWGRQLRAAGVNLNLAPVADTVWPKLGTANAPIGYFGRQYGNDSYRSTAGSGAFFRGMQAAGVAATAKHFPGLGVVRYNTDTTRYVYDTGTTVQSAYLNPFKSAVTGGIPLVMMSSAIYTRIDGRQPATFSSTLMNLLRNGFHFNGVIISDDVSAAAAMAPYSYANRALRFLSAGGNLVLASTINGAATMYDAVLARARSNPTFRSAIVDVSVRRILSAKQRYGLLPPTC